ncbi:MAG: YlxR family protein [Clostridiales bacterium]|nr:YlxR family protein [Clostridiales bacterium]
MPPKPRKIPMRMCVGCREMKPKKELIRAVRSPEGEVGLDPTGKKAGRGAYVCMNADCLKRALKQKQLDRALEAHLDEAATQQLTETMQRILAQQTAEGKP